MAYFNQVTRLISETITADTTEALYEGGVRQSSYDTTPWMCNACRLVWSRQGQAIDCARRKHRNQYADTYYYNLSIDGVPHLVEQTYVRRAVRRDGPRPGAVGTGSSEPVFPSAGTVDRVADTSTTRETDALVTVADVRAAALVLGYRLSRIPVKPPVPETFEITEHSEDPAF
jgi:hypothetical protein